MLPDGINHVAVLTSDTDRLTAFYGEVFDATIDGEMREREGFRLTLLNIGPPAQLNVFEIAGNDEATSLFYRDPDGLESEVCVGNPDAQPGVLNPPGTPSPRYHAS